MSKGSFKILQGTFARIDTGFSVSARIFQSQFSKVNTDFSVSARCIFVHKNNLAAPHTPGRGNASELGIPATPAISKPIYPIAMPRKKAKDQVSLLTYSIRTRVTEKVYQRLTAMVNTSDCHSVGEVARRILSQERIRIFHQDSSLDNVMHELALIRKELNAIGTNINQVVHHFHLAEGDEQKMVQAFKVVEQYNKVGDKVSKLLDMVSALTKKWLQR